MEISADLYFGDSNKVLKKGLGQYIGSFIPGYGKPLLINNNGQFSQIEKCPGGDIVTITTSYGVYQYQVTGMQIAASTDKSAYDLGQNKEQLILYTCYPFDTLGLTPTGISYTRTRFPVHPSYPNSRLITDKKG